MHTLDSDPVGLKYRCQWSPPLAIDWFDNSVYFGCQALFRTRDRGQTWEELHKDLSTGDPSRIQYSGGVVGDNLGQFYGATISAIAPSRTEKGVVWVGTNDGKVWISRDAGKTFTDLSKNVGMPAWGLVRRIDSSHFEPGTAYMAVDYHLVDIRDPYLYKTTDFGKTWTNITGNLPKGHPLDYTLSIAENPRRKGMVFAGTGHGFFYSLDDGKTWKQFKDRLPAAPVNYIEVPKNAAEVAIATYGRGIWILRDAWALEYEDTLTQPQDLQLLKPVPATRVAAGGNAEFVFNLAADQAAPITIEVVDSRGARVNTATINGGKKGLNRYSWAMTYPSANQPVLRSTPPDNPYIWEAGRWSARERPVTHWGIGSQRWQPRVAPGKYTVRMTYNGKQHSQPFEVLRDVTLPSTDEDLLISTDLQRQIVAALDESVDKINRIEIMRAQVEDLRKQHASNRQHDQALEVFYKKMYDTELHYLSRTEMHSDDKWYVEKYKLYLNLVWLLGEVGGQASDVAGGVGYRPTTASQNVFRDLSQQLETAGTDFSKLMREIEAFNKAHAGEIAPITDKLYCRPPAQ